MPQSLSLRENQATAGCTLTIIFEHEVARNASARLRPQTAHRRHHNAMLERKRPNLHGREQLLFNI